MPLRLRLDRTDAALAEAWSDAIAAAIADAVRGRSAPHDVVRFRSRRHALIAMTQAVAEREHRDAWAWRRLGLWPSRDVENEELLVAVEVPT